MDNKLYNEIYNIEQKHWWFVGRRKIISKFLASSAPKPSRLAIDIGCGTGLQAQLLNKFSNEVVGLEFSDVAISFAKKLNPNFKIIKGEFPAFETGQKYDIVTLFDVLEHIEKDGQALKKISEILNPGGVALITVPAFNFLWSANDKLHHHKRRYTTGSLKKTVLSNTDLEVASISYFNFMLFLPILCFRAAKNLLNLGGESSDLFMVPSAVNKILTKIFYLESNMLGWFHPPFGVSIICVLKKKETNSENYQYV